MSKLYFGYYGLRLQDLIKIKYPIKSFYGTIFISLVHIIKIIIILMKQLYYNTPLSKSREKYKGNTRSYLSDYGGNSPIIQRIRNKEINGNKLKLIEIDNPLMESGKRSKYRAHSYYSNYPELQDLSKVKNDVLRLEEEVLARKKDKLSSRTNEVMPVSRFRARTLPYELEVPQRSSLQLRKQFLLNQDRIWQFSDQLSSSRRKKLYKIKKRHKKYLFDTNDQQQSLSHSFITLKKRRNRQDEQDFEQPLLYKVKHPMVISRFLFRSSRNKHKFRKIGNVVLFIIRLRRYNQRMRIRRFDIFKKYVRGDLNKKLIELKNQLIRYSKPLFIELADQENLNYRLHEKDQPILKKEKVSFVCKLVKIQVRYIQKCVRYITQRQTFKELLYILCKHGNYTCTEELNTAQELNLECISQSYGYIRAEKNLQQSAILLLVFFKMLLYNIFLQPERIDMVFIDKISLKVIFSNIRLVGNILYELFVDVQDQILQRVPATYVIGNWNNLKNTFKFKIAEPMTIRQGYFQKNELISGLAAHKYIREVYGIESMIEEKQIMKLAVKQLHQQIVEYHEMFRRYSFTR